MAIFTKNPKFDWILRCGWKGLCPRCGKGPMFDGWLKLQKTCPECGLDYQFANADDGPAFFALCITAFPLTFFAVWLEVAYAPPWWVHVLTSVPILGIGCLATLRPFKGWLVASQYVNKAVEAGTEGLWAKLNSRRDAGTDGPA
ncbi:DUF983 domain-containing protein [Novosphingobium sp. B1]|uniref:DUF983 domain-containing protein n=1 Tax=Novosphingobium sp. B1 TaxID=1938756 RepID=UPI0009D7C75A|nr:DUF983 domain-containing protein [Novosphingobium sp. B1]SMC57460.1 Uncharacterized conserved protein, DUF983 family [Novosphingobium sp. B1]